jgi:hypothetical protein
MGKTETILSEVRNKTRVPTPLTCIQYDIGILSQSTRQEKQIQRIQIGKEEFNLPLCAVDMILYLKEPERHLNYLLRHKHFQQSRRTNNQYTKIRSFSVYQQWTDWKKKQEKNIIDNRCIKVKYTVISVMREVNDLYNESYKSLKKEI